MNIQFIIYHYLDYWFFFDIFRRIRDKEGGSMPKKEAKYLLGTRLIM